jgi:hypothetical protein
MKPVIFCLAAFLLTSCERRTEVRLGGGDPPTFYLSGSGRLGTTIVYGPEQERIADRDPFDKTYAIWEMEPEKKGEGAALQVEGLTVTYGAILPGYKQLKPNSGLPPPLIPGKRYRYWFVTVNAPGASGYFEIRDGKAVKVDGP